MRSIRFSTLPFHDFAPGFRAWTLRGEALGRSLDPYIAVDIFEMEAPHFPPHPHAGFSAVTYMLPSSLGGFINRDSLGDRSMISPGDVHWTEAGSGIIHEEVPSAIGTVARGLQLFVDVPAEKKLDAPQVYHRVAAEIPRRRFGDAIGRVIADAGLGLTQAIDSNSTVILIDLEIPGSGIAMADIPGDWNIFGLRLDGHLSQEQPTHREEPVLLLDLSSGYGSIVLEAESEGARVVLLGGPRLRQPLAFGGSFVMSTPEQLLDAKRRYASGGMGRLSPSF